MSLPAGPVAEYFPSETRSHTLGHITIRCLRLPLSSQEQKIHGIHSHQKVYILIFLLIGSTTIINNQREALNNKKKKLHVSEKCGATFLFQYYGVKPNATKSYQGTGLGLYISKSIVEAHGGKMWAENNTDGKGATFAFALPLVNKNRVDKAATAI